MWIYIELIIVFFTTMLGFFALKSIFFSWRRKKGHWRAFRKTARRLSLEVKGGPLPDYDMPNLYGDFRGRKVYVHPAKRKEQNSTVYGVSNAIKLEGDMVVTSPKTTILETYMDTLKVRSLGKEGLKIMSPVKENQKLAGVIFTDKAVEKLKELVDMKGDLFRALIMENGICMFSTYRIPEDEEEIESTLELLADMTECLESEVEGESISNIRFQKVSRGSRMVTVELVLMGVFTLTGILALFTVPVAFSWIALNMGIMLILVSALRIFTIAETRGWLRG